MHLRFSFFLLGLRCLYCSSDDEFEILPPSASEKRCFPIVQDEISWPIIEHNWDDTSQRLSQENQTRQPPTDIDPFEVNSTGTMSIGQAQHAPNSSAWNRQAIPFDYTRKEVNGAEQPLSNSAFHQFDGNIVRETTSRGFTSARWQHGIPKPILSQLYQSLTYNWPALEEKIGKKWDAAISRYLCNNPELVEALLKNKKKAFAHVLEWCRPEHMASRRISYSRLGKRKRQNRPITVTWLVGDILAFDKDLIFERLSKYWNHATKSAVQGRITMYVKEFGKIHSPGALLSSDEETFRRAADTIFMTSKVYKSSLRHPDAGLHDLLHQPDAQYGRMDQDGRVVHVPYEPSQQRPNAKRYHTPHSWLNGLSLNQIDSIHNAVAAHFSKKVDWQKRLSLFLSLNKYLEENCQQLELIKAGSDYAAWKAAKAITIQDCYMQHPSEYHPASL